MQIDLNKEGFRQIPNEWIRLGKSIIIKKDQEQYKDLSGVYVVVSNNGEALYAGQSLRILQKVKEEVSRKVYSIDNIFYYKKIYNSDKRWVYLNDLLISNDPELNRRPWSNYKTIYLEIERFKEWLDQYPKLHVKAIKKYALQVSKFLEQYDSENITEESFNRFIKAHPRLFVKAALGHYARFRGYKDYQLSPKLRDPTKNPTDFFDWETLDILIEKLRNKKDWDSRDVYWVFRLLHHTGARISEILQLNSQQFNRHLVGETMPLTLIVKGNKTREVEIYSGIFSELKNYLFEEKGSLSSDYCFFRECKSRNAAYEKLRYIVEKNGGLNPENSGTESKFSSDEVAKLKKTHNFRRAVANWQLKVNDYNITPVQHFLGHESPKTTEEYISEMEKKKAGQKATMHIINAYQKSAHIPKIGDRHE